MNELVERNQGPVVAVVVPLLLLLLLLLVSKPELLLWLAGAVGLALLVKFAVSRRSESNLEENEEYEAADEPASDCVLAQIEALFGTTDIDLIDAGVSAMYEELDQLRAAPRKGLQVQRIKQRLTAASNERDKAIAISERWQSKAIANDEELARLRKLTRENNWQAVPDDELNALLATVSLKDNGTENTFLSSKRRQRRLMQVLRGSNMAIMQKK